jgi:hypothetical protein
MLVEIENDGPVTASDAGAPLSNSLLSFYRPLTTDHWPPATVSLLSGTESTRMVECRDQPESGLFRGGFP